MDLANFLKDKYFGVIKFMSFLVLSVAQKEILYILKLHLL